MSTDNVTENSIEEEAIPSVTEDDDKKKNQIFFAAIALIIAAGGSVLWMQVNGGEEQKKQETLEAQVEQGFDQHAESLSLPQEKSKLRAVATPVLPKDVNQEEKKGFLQRPKVEPKAEKLETRQEAQARLKAEKAMERRRKASPVVFNRKLAQQSKNNSMNATEKARLNLESVTKSIVDKVGGVANNSKMGLLGGRAGSSNRDEMASRLESTQTVGVTASFIADKAHTIAQGKMLGCILETAIHSALPGMTRCVLTENVYSYDGRLLLLKKGSRLVGQYEGGIQHGESRIFVIWTRVITPEGIDVDLKSPGTGDLGRAGHGVYIDSHFFERFGASALLSIIGGLAASESEGDVRLEAVGDSFNESAEIALKESIKIRPTGHKNQGERIKVFVARDIDFKPVLELARNYLHN